MKTPKKPKLFKLEKWKQKEKLATVVWPTTYAVCKFLKAGHEKRLNKGEFFKIVKDV